MKMTHAVDPKQDLMSKMGDLSEIEVFNNNILVAIYMRLTKQPLACACTDDMLSRISIRARLASFCKDG
jgi:hypothetical protein